MDSTFDLADVPVVNASDFAFVLQSLVESGNGLALLRGLAEDEIRAIEDLIWTQFGGCRQTRLSVALRFRALLDVFGHRRLKALFLDRGFRMLEAIATEAASRPLNVRFGFNPQRLLLALDVLTIRPVQAVYEDAELPLAA